MNIIYKDGCGEIVEKKSRFIANVYSVQTEEEALAHIDQIRKKHYDARHHCFAYVIGYQNECVRCSDDGEPSGTAGRPILDVINGARLHNVLIVVTRYFGGTLLGTGGLVRAYSAAAKEGIARCRIAEQLNGQKIQVTTDYTGIGKLQYIAANLGLIELAADYTKDVTVTMLVPTEKAEQFHQEMTEISAGKAQLEVLEDVLYVVIDGNAELIN